MLPHTERFVPILEQLDCDVIAPDVIERMSEKEILSYAGEFDGTICGDDQYTENVIKQCAPRLKVISKWGTGIDSIDKKTADAVGITVFSSSYQETMHGGRFTYAYKESAKVAKYIKEIEPDIPIIIGGPHCSIQPEKSLNEIPSADISVEGDGEHVINEIAKSIKGSKNLSDINGIYYRKNNVIKKGKPAKIIQNLDSIPFPARHLVEKYDYGKSSK